MKKSPYNSTHETETTNMVLTIVVMGLLSACNSVTKTNDTVYELDAMAHSSPSWAPDGRSIAFVGITTGGGGALFVIDTSGTNLQQVIEGPVWGTTWSPDGQWLASSWSGIIFKVSVTGDSITMLGDYNEDFRPQWSPSGELIAFDRTICDPDCGAFLVSASGGASRKVTGYNPPPGYTWGRYPSWSSDQNKIYVAVIRWSTGGKPNVRMLGHSFYSISLDSLTSRELAAFDTKDDVTYARVDPSGRWIAFSRRPPGKYSQVWKVDLATNQYTQLTFDGGSMPAWSPDGQMIVYTRTQRDDGALWIMLADGSGKRRLTHWPE